MYGVHQGRDHYKSPFSIFRDIVGYVQIFRNFVSSYLVIYVCVLAIDMNVF